MQLAFIDAGVFSTRAAQSFSAVHLSGWQAVMFHEFIPSQIAGLFVFAELLSFCWTLSLVHQGFCERKPYHPVYQAVLPF